MSKKVWIYCGIPGAGKSTHVKTHGRAAVCSADFFFIDARGNYNFERDKLGEAHGLCLRDFVRSLQHGDPEIVVDNTNTTVAEVAPYAALALAYGYELEIVTILCDPEIAHARNVHGVPLKSVKEMDERLRRRHLPAWWKQTTIHAE